MKHHTTNELLALFQDGGNAIVLVIDGDQHITVGDLVRRLVNERRVNAAMTEYLAGELADAKGAPFEGCSDNWTGWILVARGHVAQEDEKRAAKQQEGAIVKPHRKGGSE